jgi:hypothetical protein
MVKQLQGISSRLGYGRSVRNLLHCFNKFNGMERIKRIQIASQAAHLPVLHIFQMLFLQESAEFAAAQVVLLPVVMFVKSVSHLLKHFWNVKGHLW